MTMKRAVFWNVAPCGFIINWHRFIINLCGATSQKTAFFDTKINLKNLGCEVINWIHVAQGQGILNMVMNFWHHKRWISWSAINFWGRTLLHVVCKQHFDCIQYPLIWFSVVLPLIWRLHKQTLNYLIFRDWFDPQLKRVRSLPCNNNNNSSVVLVCEWSILTEWLPLVCKVSAYFCWWRVSHGRRGGSLQPYSRFSKLELLLFLPSSSLIVLVRLSGPRSRPTTSQKIW
jgi:hypothetical protein